MAGREGPMEPMYCLHCAFRLPAAVMDSAARARQPISFAEAPAHRRCEFAGRLASAGIMADTG